MICKLQPRTYKMTLNGFAYDFWLYHFKTWNLKKLENQKNLKTLINTQNPLKTSLNNLIWSNSVVLEPTLNFDQRLTKFNRLLMKFLKIWRSLIDWKTLINLLTQFDHSKWLKYDIKARKWPFEQDVLFANVALM